MTRFWPVVLLFGALPACGDAPRRDVQYYLDHPHERFAELAACRESAAAQAEHNAAFRDYWRDKLPIGDDDSWLTSSRP